MISIKKAIWLVAFATGMTLTGSVSANNQPKEVKSSDPQQEKERTFDFTSANTQNLPLRISNAYGKVELKNWDKQEIKVQVRIIAKNTSSRNADDVLDRVEINRREDGNGVSFETKISRGNWKDLVFNGSSSVSIDYEVYLPENTPISISNSYGKIALPNRSGSVKIQLAYGDLDAKTLKNKDNTIQASYSKINIEKIHKASLKASYSKVSVQQADEIQASLTYSTGALFEQISTSLTGTFTYSSGLKIRLGEKIQNATITSTYSNINLIPHSQSKFDFEIQATYGKIKLGSSKATLQREVDRGSVKRYSGYWNQSGSANKINITATYGNVEFP